MDLSPASREPMRPPAPTRVVVVSLIIGLVFNLLPWSGWALASRPDFLLVVLLYWAMHESRHFGQGLGFFLGLVMDVADSVLLGQHALAYVVAIYLLQFIRIRLFGLSVVEQALHVLGILFIAGGVNVLLNLSLGQDFPGFAMVMSPMLGALLWPLVHVIATLPRFRQRNPITVMG